MGERVRRAGRTRGCRNRLRRPSAQPASSGRGARRPSARGAARAGEPRVRLRGWQESVQARTRGCERFHAGGRGGVRFGWGQRGETSGDGWRRRRAREESR